MSLLNKMFGMFRAPKKEAVHMPGIPENEQNAKAGDILTCITIHGSRRSYRIVKPPYYDEDSRQWVSAQIELIWWNK